MSPALGYLDLQLDLPRNEGPTAEAARLTGKSKSWYCASCIDMEAGGCRCRMPKGMVGQFSMVIK